MKADYRKHKRRLIKGVIDLEIHDDRKSFKGNGLVTGMLNNISKSGIGMRSMNPIETGTAVIVKRLQMTRDASGYDILGHVAWIKASGPMYSIGISLEEEIAQDLHPDLN